MWRSQLEPGRHLHHLVGLPTRLRTEAYPFPPTDADNMSNSLCGTDICDACGSRWGEVTGCDAACDASAAAFGPSASAVAVDAAAGPASTVDPPCPVDFARHIEVTLAQARGLDHPELREVRTRQLEEQKRFLLFEQKQKWTMWTRHGQLRVDMSDRHAELERSLQAKVRLRGECQDEFEAHTSCDSTSAPPRPWRIGI